MSRKLLGNQFKKLHGKESTSVLHNAGMQYKMGSSSRLQLAMVSLKIEVDFCTEVSCLKFHLKVSLLCAGRGFRGFLMKGDLVLGDEKN